MYGVLRFLSTMPAPGGQESIFGDLWHIVEGVAVAVVHAVADGAHAAVSAIEAYVLGLMH